MIDMGRGSEGYKFQFTREVNQNWQITISHRRKNNDGFRSVLFTMSSGWDRLVSRFVCEAEIAKIISKEKGILGGVSGYISHLSHRLFQKKSGLNAGGNSRNGSDSDSSKLSSSSLNGKEND